MDMNFEANGVFTVSMVPYIATTIKDFPEIIASSAPTPHMDNLFKVRDASETKYLPEEPAIKFHHTLLFFLAT